jgi:carbonic anhydrase
VSDIDALLDNSSRYARGFSNAGLPVRPARKVAVVACMDARLRTGALLGLREGDLHVIRSVMISQRLLGTREVMLIHHTDCGMLTFTDGELKDAVEKDTGIRPPFAIEAFPDLEADVRQSIARLQASPFIPHKHAIRGFVYEVETGRLREVT